MLKAVLFDLDDTLYDHRHSSRSALAVLQKKLPAVLGMVSLDELERVNLSILNEIHIEVLSGTIDVESARRKRFSQLLLQYDFTLTEEQLAEVSSVYREAYQQSWRASIGAVELLTALREKGLKIGIISNNLVEEQMEKLRVCNLLDHIDSLTISEEAGIAKPDPQIFRIAL
ncbi:MAG TPA: HAD family hydrolase, partial [Candidatus Kapabacteria bacterium]|nr:HAD family hydrolase [Candidatus Kapabacteria bacterium]